MVDAAGVEPAFSLASIYPGGRTEPPGPSLRLSAGSAPAPRSAAHVRSANEQSRRTLRAWRPLERILAAVKEKPEPEAARGGDGRRPCPSIFGVIALASVPVTTAGPNREDVSPALPLCFLWPYALFRTIPSYQ